jgi:hypothetical protein
MDGVVPLSVECRRHQVDIGQLLVRDPFALGVGSLIESAPHRESRLGRRGGNQLDNDVMGHQGLAPPVLGNEREEAMLDFVPFTRPRRQMAHVNWQSQLIGQLLQLDFPQPQPIPVAPAPSAMINKEDACGYKGRPISYHQVRIVSTAHSAVS